MSKQEFLNRLRAMLSGLPKQELEERLAFYGEMIDDRIEEGRTEEEAVLDIGSAEEISAQIIKDIPLSKIAKERFRPKSRIKTWEIVLLAVGSPIWLSLAIAALAVVISLYIVLWSVVISVWSVFAALAACTLGVTFAGIVFAINGNSLSGIAAAGAGIVCAGLAIFLFFGCKAATRGIILLTKAIALGIKRSFVRKESV